MEQMCRFDTHFEHAHIDLFLPETPHDRRAPELSNIARGTRAEQTGVSAPSLGSKASALTLTR